MTLSFAATPIMIALLAAPLDNAGFYLFLAVAFGWIAAIAGRLRRVWPVPRQPRRFNPVTTRQENAAAPGETPLYTRS
jgi:hypothetical protein